MKVVHLQNVCIVLYFCLAAYLFRAAFQWIDREGLIKFDALPTDPYEFDVFPVNAVLNSNSLLNDIESYSEPHSVHVECDLGSNCELNVLVYFRDPSKTTFIDWSQLEFTGRIISSSTVCSTRIENVSGSNASTNLFQIKFTPRERSRHAIEIRLEYLNRSRALCEPVIDYGFECREQYLGVLAANNPIMVEMMGTNNMTTIDEENLCVGHIDQYLFQKEGFWQIDPKYSKACSGFSVFTQHQKCGDTKHIDEGYTCRAIWRESDCTYPKLNHVTVKTCLSTWNVFLFGDSVTRQMVTALGDSFPAEVQSLTPNETNRIHWEGYRNPRKLEFPKLFNTTTRSALKNILQDKSWRSSRDVLVFNVGLHDVAFSSVEEYSAYIPGVLQEMVKANFSRLVVRLTTAVHPHVVPGGPIDRHWKLNDVRIEKLNEISIKIIRDINEESREQGQHTKIEIMNTHSMTKSRPDGLRCEDMRHYNSNVMLEMWTVLFNSICAV
eukprot:CFRG1302T1